MPSARCLLTSLSLIAAQLAVSSALAQAVDAAPAPPARAGLPPVEAFFGKPQYSDVTLSPDGTLLAALVPVNGRRNVALIDLEKRSAFALTGLTDLDVSSYRWVGDRMLEVTTANLGDALGLVSVKGRFLIDTEGRVVRDLQRTAYRTSRTADTIGGGGVALDVIDSVGRSGDDLVIVTNERNRYGLDAYRYNPRTSEKSLLTFRSPGEVSQFIVDHSGQVRVAVTSPKGGEKTAWWYRSSNTSDWTKVREAAAEEELVTPLGFDFDDRTLYVSVQSDGKGGKSGVYAFDPTTGAFGAPLFESPVAGSALRFDRGGRRVVGVADTSLVGTHWIDPEWDRLQRSIDAALPGMRNRLSWAAYDTQRVIIASDSGARPATFYLLDRRTHKMERVAETRPALEDIALGTRSPVRYAARDGLSIPGYLTLPPTGPKTNLPLVVIIHGGPFVPGEPPGYDDEAHFLASRGYAVLQPDFRGTKGYGDAFYKAGWRQWGLAMQDDVTDGVEWLVRTGVADKDRVCLFGASYGGYATLWGLEKEPDRFRCGVAFVAVSDLDLMFSVTWSDVMMSERDGDQTKTLTRWIGDPDKERDKLRAVSPIYHADRIKAPLLLAYGAADQRVPLIHGKQMRSALDKYDKPYEWVVYDNEAHGFNKDENRYDFYRRVDAFLAKNLAPRPAPVATAATP